MAGMKLREWLGKNGKTQEAFAADLGTTQARISQIILKGTMDARMGLRIEEATEGQVSLRELLTGERALPGSDKSGVAA